MTDDQLLENIRQQLNQLQIEYISYLGPFEQTMRGRLLRLFEEWKQVNLRRTADLSDAALEMYRQERLVPACTLTRSVFETVGLQYYMHKRIVMHTIKPNPELIHKLLISAVFGRKDLDWSDAPIQVLKVIDDMDKEFQGARSEYDRLCEYAHPNMSGGFGTYVHTNESTSETNFGKNPIGLRMGPWGLVSLSLILMIAAEINNRVNSSRAVFESMVKTHAPVDLYKST